MDWKRQGGQVTLDGPQKVPLLSSTRIFECIQRYQWFYLASNFGSQSVFSTDGAVNSQL